MSFRLLQPHNCYDSGCEPPHKVSLLSSINVKSIYPDVTGFIFAGRSLPTAWFWYHLYITRVTFWPHPITPIRWCIRVYNLLLDGPSDKDDLQMCCFSYIKWGLMSCSTVANHHPSMHLFSLPLSHSYTLGNTNSSHEILHIFYHHPHAIVFHRFSCGALFCRCLEACRSSVSGVFQDFTREISGMKETREGKESREEASDRRILGLSQKRR